jgi:purine-nucleoside/S-methyl-5'-thioadenosine phosphorylase / adenosine deaminase
MSGAIPRLAVAREDLGGGFHLVTDDRGVAIVGTGLPGGFEAWMTPASVNARNRAELNQWVERRAPGADARLRGVDQVHSATVLDAVELRDGSRREADGMYTVSPDDIPVVMAADCAPVWLADASARVFALVHAGWRGVCGGILEAGVHAVTSRGGRPERMVAAIGPHLQACCFEVGPEVADRFAAFTRPAGSLVSERHRSDSVALDLAAAIAARLRAAGVRTIGIAEACTRCRADLLHSYRRNGKGGPLMAALALMPGNDR